jgi:hypothetical protein
VGRLVFACAILCAVAAASAGCATCDPEEPAARPRVGGAVGTGSGGSWSALGIGLDVTNLFCRSPKPEPEPATDPGAAEAEDALPDPSTAQDPSHTVTPPHE